MGKVFETGVADIGSISNGNQQISGSLPNRVFPTPTNIIKPTAQTPTNSLTLTASEAAKHNTLQDCWLIISGSVYDVTRFIYQHPGGVSEISTRCGTDATTAFQTLGGRGKNHSNLAYSMLSGYLIGNVGSSVDVTTPVASTSQTTGTGSTTTTQVTNTQTATTQTDGLPQAIYAIYPDAVKNEGSYEDNGSWEGKINSSAGCRAIKVSSSGSITEDKKC